jgi:TolB-like protein
MRSVEPRRRRTRARRVALVAAALLLAGCAGTGRHSDSGGTVPTDHPRAALLPFENLSGREEQGRLFTQAFLVELVKSGACEMVEPGQVDEMLDRLQIRTTGALSNEQLRLLGDSLDVRYVFLGSVLEAGTVKTWDGDIPSAGASLRMVETATARVTWAGLRVGTGDDRETVFGWGREQSAERLIARLAREMLGPFADVGAAWRRQGGKIGGTK